jgi:hypothetical protein
LIITTEAINLAKAVLEGNQLAADVLADWVVENRNSKEQVSIQYVQNLEDGIRAYYHKIREWYYEPYFMLTESDYRWAGQVYYKLERDGRQLGRMGVS